MTLNEYVLEAFNKMLYEGNNLIKRDEHRNYIFNVNNVEICLNVFGKSSKDNTTNNPITFKESERFNPIYNWTVTMPDQQGYRFYMTINNRQYVVPELSRIDEAKAIDRIEELLQLNEIATFNNILNYKDINNVGDITELELNFDEDNNG